MWLTSGDNSFDRRLSRFFFVMKWASINIVAVPELSTSPFPSRAVESKVMDRMMIEGSCRIAEGMQPNIVTQSSLA